MKKIATGVGLVKKFGVIGNETIKENLETLAGELQKGKRSLNLGSYAYTPTGGKKWKTSDGGEITGTIYEVIEGWGWRGMINDLAYIADPQSLIEEYIIVRERIDQETFEGGQLKGDWR